MAILSAKGSLYATRPTLMTYIARRADLLANARELFEMVGKGAVKIARQAARYPLREAAAAHRDLEARKTTGSIVLHPVTPERASSRLWLARGNHEREGVLAACAEANRLRQFDAISRAPFILGRHRPLASARAVYQFSSAR